MRDLASFRRQAVETAHSPDVDIPSQVIGQRPGIIAGQAVLCGVMNKTQMLGSGIIDPRQSACGGGHPEPSQTIYVKGGDESFRQTIGGREACKSPCRVTCQAALVKTKPQIAGSILSKRGCGFHCR